MAINGTQAEVAHTTQFEQIGDCADGLNIGEGGKSLENLVVQCENSRLRSTGRHGDAHGENLFGLEAEVNTLHRKKTANEQACSRKENDRHGKLRNHEHIPSALQ